MGEKAGEALKFVAAAIIMVSEIFLPAEEGESEMTVLIVDDEEPAALSLERVVEQVLGAGTRILTARDGKGALALAAKSRPDLAFLDVQMPGMNGLELARRLEARDREINIIIVTAHPQYALPAWQLHVSDYLLKPAGEEDVRLALANLRRPVRGGAGQRRRLRIQCFGNFEVFVDERPLAFHRSGAKELLAYLVSRRGASASTGELCSVLWEDDRALELKKSYLRTNFAVLKKTLEGCGLGAVLCHSRDSYSVDPSQMDCDYYRYLERDPVARGTYQGEFMRQYSWAEMLIGGLEAPAAK